MAFHEEWGNQWERISGQLPGRTGTSVSNRWRLLNRKKERRSFLPPQMSERAGRQELQTVVAAMEEMDSPVEEWTWPRDYETQD
jgi:hypothetical protein